MGALKNRVGERYGKLLVLEQAESKVQPNGKSKVMWKCQCDCGNICHISSSSLGKGTKSCGCLKTTAAKNALNQINNSRKAEKEANIGKRFGSLVVLEISDQTKSRPTDYWICQCDCGNTFSTLHSNITSGKFTDCGCKDLRYYRFKDISGQRFGKLTAISPVLDKQKSGESKKWYCKCDCGNEVIVTVDALQKGNTMSCGCLKQSQGELIIEQILKDNNIEFEREKYAFDYNTGGKARFDFFVNNKYAIEFDGEQHYQSNNRWWNTENFVEKQKERDQAKNDYCKNNNIPLIRIPYTHKMNIVLKDLIIETSEFVIIK